jgi:hypothetical protein
VFREDVEKCLEAGMNGHVGKPLGRIQTARSAPLARNILFMGDLQRKVRMEKGCMKQANPPSIILFIRLVKLYYTRLTILNVFVSS